VEIVRGRRFRERGRAALVLLATLARAPSAAAAPAAPAATDEADALFEEGRRLMAEGHLPEACGKLEKSFQLAPRLGTMLNLGACSERRGELAHAITLYERAATLAHQLGRPDREAAAREFAAALAPRVGKLLVVVAEPLPELVAQVDGETLSTQSGLVPIDPGTRHLIARAPGRTSFQATLTIRAGETTTVTIPKLAKESAPRAPDDRAPTAPGGGRTWLLVGGLGVTAVAAGVGAFFGLRAKSKHDDSSAFCDATGCTADGLTLIDQAKTAGNVSTVAFVVAGAALAGTVLAYVLTGDAAPTRAAGRVGLALGPLGVVGAF
jgi:hypothetical protein